MSVNDNIRNALESYGGFTINERIYYYLGSLGYTGTISDRLAKYVSGRYRGYRALVEDFGKGETVLEGLIRTLYGNGKRGVMYIPQPQMLGQRVLWQDSAGTVPVMSDGDPVGLMLDLSGNGNHASQSTSAARPIYRTDGVLHWLEGDGVGKFISVPASESMRWATVNASIAEKVVSYWSLRTRSLSTANGLSGFSLTTSGPTPWAVGSFIRNNGEFVRRTGSNNDELLFSFNTDTSNRVLLLKEYVHAGVGGELSMNNLSSGFMSLTRQTSLDTPIELPWGILAVGNNTFHMDADFFGGVFYAGEARVDVDAYMRSIMPPVEEL